jgi:hypothetical protein
MDSKIINKLIRSEIWPILRGYGFTTFESRTAFAYNGPFINVVNFQSFNSYKAEGLGCTTFSFAVNLGAHVLGCPSEDFVKVDKSGRLRPFEYQCQLRHVLRKRSPVDGFARDVIFYIHPDGRTTAACFQELRHLMQDFVPRWFEAQNNLDDLLSRIESAEESGSNADVASMPNPGSYNWNKLKSILALVRMKETASGDQAGRTLSFIEETVGTLLDFSTIVSDRPRQERYAIEIRELWDQLGDFRPTPAQAASVSGFPGCLISEIWTPPKAQHDSSFSGKVPVALASARSEIWPALREAGFAEFTDRLAHRISGEIIEVVEFLPVDREERKSHSLSEGLFRLGVGVFWPALGGHGIFRTNRKGDPRPVANECHISNWLAPKELRVKGPRTAFASVDDALLALKGPGMRWLDLFRNPVSGQSLLLRRDWELFWLFPMMRGYGARPSSRRLVYLALLASMAGEMALSGEYLNRAEGALQGWYPVHHYKRMKAWVEESGTRIHQLDSK